MTCFQKQPNNVGNLGEKVVSTGFKKSSKQQKIAQSGHTGEGEISAYKNNATLKQRTLPGSN